MGAKLWISLVIILIAFGMSASSTLDNKYSALVVDIDNVSTNVSNMTLGYADYIDVKRGESVLVIPFNIIYTIEFDWSLNNPAQVTFMFGDTIMCDPRNHQSILRGDTDYGSFWIYLNNVQRIIFHS